MRFNSLNRIIILLAIGFCLAGNIYATTIAVLDFQNNCFVEPEKYENLSQGLADIMITELSQIQSIQIVERSQFKTIHDEMNLSQSGMIDEAESIEIGKMLGAQQLVFGGYMITGNDKIRIDVRIVQVETGLTLKASEVTGKVKDVLNLIDQLSKNICQDLNIELSTDERKLLENGKRINPEAMMLFSKGLAFEDRGNLQRAKECYIQALRIEPEFKQAKIRARRIVMLERKK